MNSLYKITFCRVPLIINQAARVNFGFASNMVHLMWCVRGGLLLHMLEANYLSILLKANYEKPVDTAQDIIDRELTILGIPGSESLVEISKNSPSAINRKLAERSIVPEVIFLKFKINNSNFPERIITIMTNTLKTP